MTRKTVLVVVVQVVALTWLAALLPTWQDEEFTLATTAHGIAYAIHRALTYELQAPVYFAFVAALRMLGKSVFVAREFSVVAEVATTIVAATLARRIWPNRDPWIFCALVAFNPFSVYAGVEIRTYALALLEDAALIAVFFEGFLYATNRPARFAFVALAIVGLYTQYFIAFEIVGLFFALVVQGRIRPAIAYVACSAAAMIAFAPLALYVRGQASGALSVEASAPMAFGGMLLHPINLILSHDYANAGGSIPTIAWIVARILILAAIGIGKPRLDRNVFAILAIFAIVDLIYVFVSDVEKINLVIPRHFIALFFPESLGLYAIVSAFTGRFAKRCGLAIVGIVALSGFATLATTYASGAKLGDAERVGVYLSQNAKAGDAIAVYPGDGVPPIERYYSGPLSIHGYPVPLDENTYHVDSAFVRSDAAANAAFDRLPHTRRLYFVALGDCGTDNIHGCATVHRAMKRRFKVLYKQAFFEATIFELVPKPSTM